jgi:hypothetical protein
MTVINPISLDTQPPEEALEHFRKERADLKLPLMNLHVC